MVFPLTIVALAVAVMIGDGACAHVSILLGMKKSDDAASAVGNAVILTIVSSLLITALYLIFSKSILIFGLKWGMMGAAVATIASFRCSDIPYCCGHYSPDTEGAFRLSCFIDAFHPWIIDAIPKFSRF